MSELQLGSTEEKIEALEALTEDAGSFGTIEVAVSVTVLITTTDDVEGNITVRSCLSVCCSMVEVTYPLMFSLQLTDDFLSVVDNLLEVNEETL